MVKARRVWHSLDVRPYGPLSRKLYRARKRSLAERLLELSIHGIFSHIARSPSCRYHHGKVEDFVPTLFKGHFQINKNNPLDPLDLNHPIKEMKTGLMFWFFALLSVSFAQERIRLSPPIGFQDGSTVTLVTSWAGFEGVYTISILLDKSASSTSSGQFAMVKDLMPQRTLEVDIQAKSVGEQIVLEVSGTAREGEREFAFTFREAVENKNDYFALLGFGCSVLVNKRPETLQP